jgi:hypothetical protein
MSKRAGEVFEASPTYADPSNPHDLGVKPSWGPQKRERIPVGKMFGMPQGRALVWLPSSEALMQSRVKGYFEIPALAARTALNPYYATRATPAFAPGFVRGFQKLKRPLGAVMAVVIGLLIGATRSTNVVRGADGHTWAMACGAPIGGLSMRERAQKPSLSPAECPEDALIYVRRVCIVGEDRLILMRSRENRQQLGKW